MKKGIITMMALMLGMSGMMAQNKLVVAGAGDVKLRQGETLEVKCEGDPINFTPTPDGNIVLTSYKDYEVTVPALQSIRVSGSGDLQSVGTLDFPKLNIIITGTGDAKLNIECDTIDALLTGIGDLILSGHCRYLEANITGLGDLDFKDFTADTLNINKTGGKDISITLPKGGFRHESLLFDPNWNGVDAGLNMLLGPGTNANFTGDYALLEQRPMRSWNFNFNIADVGLAFSHSHRAGIYTGIGLGWNNFSFNSPMRLEKGDNQLICNAIDESVEGRVKRSKLGVLYLQAPLMIEVRPTRKFFFALGVTGGIRIDAWNKIKYDEVKVKTHSDYYINRFKLDASLRAGEDDGLGFFANFNLLPFFEESKAPTAHSISFGLSLNF